MKNLALTLMMAVAFFACNDNDAQEVSNKEKATELLKSIETGAQEPVAYINPNKYIQHNQSVGDGLEGFGEILSALNAAGCGKVDIKRVFVDGDYVITHTEYDFFGPKAGFDIFRFENGLIVEHWDNLQAVAESSASGRTQFDGPTTIKDLDKTEANKALVTGFVNDILMGDNPDKITDYISTEQYDQHNPGVKDGLDGLGEALTALADAGTPMVYEKNHIILGEGNFVLSVSEGIFLGEKVSFYDLFRIDGGKIVEHWDTIETILPTSEALNNNGKFNF